MALLERVATLLRANVNDVLDKAENPPAMLKQLLRDMENQLLQLKTQVAIAIADQHMLESKRAEYEGSTAAWRRKAELALAKENESLARAAIERCLQAEQLLAGYNQQLADQRIESELVREQYRQLEAKLSATATEGELLLAAHRRSTRSASPSRSPEANEVLRRLREQVLLAEGAQVARQHELAPSIEDQFRHLEREEKVDALLAELKRRPSLLEG